MGDVYYKPLIDEMTWSYSRIESFDNCAYKWFMKYIKHYKEDPQFYSSYGTLMHKLIELYYRGIISKDEMKTKFLLDFKNEVKGLRPSNSIVEKYIEDGCKYLDSFEPFRFKMIDVEKRVYFNIDDIPLVGVIDYLGEDDDGELVIVDNKSRNLKPRSKRKNPPVKDAELGEMLKQLYIYSAAIKQEFGKYPKLLCFNCFKSGVFIEEPFVKSEYDKTVEWAKQQVEMIKKEENFNPNIEYFKCRYLCGLNNICKYYSLGV